MYNISFILSEQLNRGDTAIIPTSENQIIIWNKYNLPKDMGLVEAEFEVKVFVPRTHLL